jgi:NAD-dependent SIR2 family protein deacetylase
MKKEIECSACESKFTLAYKEEEVEGVPNVCPFCGETLDDEYLNFDDEQDPLDIPELNDDEE